MVKQRISSRKKKMAKRRRRRQSTDRISDLPDEILHRILWLVNSPNRAAPTIVLSRRWRSLWRSYPVVEYDGSNRRQRGWRDSTWGFGEFCDSTLEKFSRDSSLRIETLKLSLRRSENKPQQLLALAKDRKAEVVEIDSSCWFSPESLSNPALKILKLRGATLFSSVYSRLPLSMNSLQELHLDGVVDCCGNKDRIFAELISGSPLLETVELVGIANLGKLNVCCTDLTKLKKLKIADCGSLEEIEMTASGLQTLHLRGIGLLSKFELTAPQLNLLEISNCWLTLGCLDVIVSKVQSLKSLTLVDLRIALEEFTVVDPDSEEIELDAGPDLAEFLVLKKCEISPACRGEVDLMIVSSTLVHDKLDKLKSLLTRFAGFTHFSTVTVAPLEEEAVDFEEEVEHTLPPVDITHLIIWDEKKAPLSSVFWALRPKFLTIKNFNLSCSSFLVHLEQGIPQHCGGLRNWRCRVKDVKMVNRDVDRALRKGIEEEELISVSKSAVAKLANQRRGCFMLTWHEN